MKVNEQRLKDIQGFLGATIVDSTTGMGMLYIGEGSIDLELNAAVATDVYRSIQKAIDTLKLNDHVEDTLISLGETYQLIRRLQSDQNLFIHMALNRKNSNLALARRTLQEFEKEITL